MNSSDVTEKIFNILLYIADLNSFYGIFAFSVLVSAQWDQIILPEDSFGGALGRRVLMARVLAIASLFLGLLLSLFYPKIFGRFLIIAVLWSWTSFIDDIITFEQGVLETNQVAGGYLTMFRPFYLFLISYIGVEHWVRYGEKFE